MMKIPILIGMMFMSIFAVNSIEDAEALSCSAFDNFPVVIIGDEGFINEFGILVDTIGTCKKLLSFEECIAHGESPAYCGSFSYEELEFMDGSVSVGTLPDTPETFVPSTFDVSSQSGVTGFSEALPCDHPSADHEFCWWAENGDRCTTSPIDNLVHYRICENLGNLDGKITFFSNLINQVIMIVGLFMLIILVVLVKRR